MRGYSLQWSAKAYALLLLCLMRMKKRTCWVEQMAKTAFWFLIAAVYPPLRRKGLISFA